MMHMNSVCTFAIMVLRFWTMVSPVGCRWSRRWRNEQQRRYEQARPVTSLILIWCPLKIGRGCREGTPAVGTLSVKPPLRNPRLQLAVGYPCGNFSDTPSWILLKPKGSTGHAFTVCIGTGNENQASFSRFGPHI